MAHWTDVIITMNEEDFQAAQKFKLRKGGKVYKVHGVGITLSAFKGEDFNRDKKRMELGLSEDDIVCISAGDLVSRKNYSVAIEAIAQTSNPKLQYLICGSGPEKEKLEN
jgi:glycosyltransferase involved in cell wall biosynthesis